MSIEAMKLALEALKWSKPQPDAEITYDQAITSLRQAIEQAQQAEPVAWITQGGKGWLRWHKSYDDNKDSVPLYTQPQEPVIDKSAAIRIATALGWTPPRQPLTDEEIFVIWEQAMVKDNGKHARLDNQPFVHFARAIEEVHGIKENT